jgi:peptidyl-prolyl cis-trans isomerase D
MKQNTTNKMSYFILTFIFLIIIASFLFSNFDNFSMGSSKNVASVDGTPISTKEYRMALQRQVEFFNQMMGGSGMTEKQMEQMGIKESVLNSLIQLKLILNTADKMGFVVSLDEVKNDIKNMPYFKTNNQFDVNLYRNALQANGYIPTQFEELVRNDLKQKKVEELFSSAILSENHVRDVMKFKNNVVVVQGVKVTRQSLAPLVSVSEQEIKDYVNNPANKKALDDAYTENASRYNKAEEVKASHILITGDDAKALEKAKALRAQVTTKNFGEIAKKETQDPTGKSNGGDLGWFSAGRMVPEFEKIAFSMKPGEISQPVKTQFGYHIIYVQDKKAAESRPFDTVKDELARMALQKTKAQDLDQLLKSEEQKLSAALTAGHMNEVEAFTKKVDGQLLKDVEVNQYDQALASANLAPQESEKLFGAQVGQVINLGNPGTIYLVKVVKKGQSKDEAKLAEDLKAEVASQTQSFSRKLRDHLIKAMGDKAKVVTNRSLL